LNFHNIYLDFPYFNGCVHYLSYAHRRALLGDWGAVVVSPHLFHNCKEVVLPYTLGAMEQQLREFVQTLGHEYIVMVGAPGLERPAILVPSQMMVTPRSRYRQVRSIRGIVQQVWYLRYQNHLRWAFAVEESGNRRWFNLGPV
jgi:hypothetical protein